MSAIQKRLRNKAFIVVAISFLALVYKTVTGTELPPQFDNIVDTGLVLLTALGVVIDPSTPGIMDAVETEK